MTDASTTPAASHRATIERYLRFWNAYTAEEQQRLAADTFTGDVEYHALVGVLTGTQALIDFRNEFAGRMGAVTFRPAAQPQLVRDRARLAWELDVRGGEPFAAGTDVLHFDRDGRIAAVSAFLDRAPEGFDPHAHDHP